MTVEATFISRNSKT